MCFYISRRYAIQRTWRRPYIEASHLVGAKRGDVVGVAMPLDGVESSGVQRDEETCEEREIERRV